MDAFPTIGRDRELAAFDALLARGRSGLALVSAQAGMGKSRFLRLLAARGVRRGMAVAFEDADGPLCVGRGDEPRRFRGRLRGMLSVGEDDPSAASAPSLADRIAGMGPTLILIDSYDPSPGFRDWFEDVFLQRLQAGDGPAVTVIADRPPAVAALAGRLTAVGIIELGPLDLDAVRAHFRSVAATFRPPLTEREVELYGHAASREPGLLDSLGKLLPLTADATETR